MTTAVALCALSLLLGGALTVALSRERERLRTAWVLFGAVIWPVALLVGAVQATRAARRRARLRRRKDRDRLERIAAQCENGDLSIEQAVNIAASDRWPAPVLRRRAS